MASAPFHRRWWNSAPPSWRRSTAAPRRTRATSLNARNELLGLDHERPSPEVADDPELEQLTGWDEPPEAHGTPGAEDPAGRRHGYRRVAGAAGHRRGRSRSAPQFGGRESAGGAVAGPEGARRATRSARSATSAGLRSRRVRLDFPRFPASMRGPDRRADARQREGHDYADDDRDDGPRAGGGKRRGGFMMGIELRRNRHRRADLHLRVDQLRHRFRQPDAAVRGRDTRAGCRRASRRPSPSAA